MNLKDLDDYIARNSLVLTVENGPVFANGIQAVHITINGAQRAISITIFDEFGDAQEENQALCLALLGLEIAVFRDARSGDDWARAQSINENSPKIDEMFERNRQAIEDFTRHYGEIPDVVSEWDWQLNSGLAHALRRRVLDRHQSQ